LDPFHTLTISVFLSINTTLFELVLQLLPKLQCHFEFSFRHFSSLSFFFQLLCSLTPLAFAYIFPEEFASFDQT
jgi:hypothetical protein